MNRWLTSVAFCAALAALVGAQIQAPGISPADQAKLFQRNRLLIRAAVESSVALSDQNADYNGYFVRADLCTSLAKRWASEIESAAKANERERASELTNLLGKVIDDGVAANLKLSRKQIESGSMQEKDLFRRRDEAIKILRPLEAALRDIEAAHKTVNDGIDNLNRAANK
jgi:hypothetical protein